MKPMTKAKISLLHCCVMFSYAERLESIERGVKSTQPIDELQTHLADVYIPLELWEGDCY
jgi:hypothetical protein